MTDDAGEPTMSPEDVVRAVAASAVYKDIDGGWSMAECAETGDAVLVALRGLGPEVVMAGIFGGSVDPQ